MTALPEFQRRFAAALDSAAGEAAMLPLLAGDEARARALLAVYRGNSAANVIAALRLAYPVCAQITGDDYFDALARRYRDAVPSSDGDLNRYGASFADFLDGFEPVRALPYLPDVARLEWAVHTASTAADAQPADASLFTGLDIDALAGAQLRFTPGFALCSSAWPVADIWLAHQGEGRVLDDIRLDHGQHAQVWREGWRVRVAPLDAATCVLWTALQGGACLGEAWTRAGECDAGFDLGAAIGDALDRGCLLALYIERT